MKIKAVLEGYTEFLPRNKTRISARKLAQQFAREAMTATGGHKTKTRNVAHTMAQRFLSDVLEAIDYELEFSGASHVDRTV